MSGLHSQLIDIALGYDDNYRSTEHSRNAYYAHWLTHARTQYALLLASPKPYVRPPANEAEHLVQKIIETTFARMKRP